MRTMNFSRLAAIPVLIAAMFSNKAIAQQQPQVPQTSSSQRVIVVSLEDRKLALIENGEVKKVYNVAVGKPSTPSPEGTFIIERRVANPTYQHDGKTVLPGPGNPVGTRWMGLNKYGYGIHGTNEPKSIGKAASHGCIRMAQPDLEELYALVSVGDTVRLVGQRNDETARLFNPDRTTQNAIVAAMPSTQFVQVATSQERTSAVRVNQTATVSTMTAAGTR